VPKRLTRRKSKSHAEPELYIAAVRAAATLPYAGAMIVTLQADGWEVIYQRAHGLLAVKLASHWRSDERGPHWVELLAAITQHDNNQKEFGSRGYLNAIGAPADFMIADGSPLEQARQVVDDASYQGRYVALMTSMHTSYIYRSKRESDEAFAAFLSEQKALQKRWRRALKLSKRDAERDYAIMQWCDRCSLILCQNELPSDGRRLEVAVTPGGEPSYIRQRSDNTVGVETWPFDAARFEVSVEAALLTQLQFGSDEELHAALAVAPTHVKSWVFAKEGGGT
jgi:hypothetical protein